MTCIRLCLGARHHHHRPRVHRQNQTLPKRPVLALFCSILLAFFPQGWPRIDNLTSGIESLSVLFGTYRISIPPTTSCNPPLARYQYCSGFLATITTSNPIKCLQQYASSNTYCRLPSASPHPHSPPRSDPKDSSEIPHCTVFARSSILFCAALRLFSETQTWLCCVRHFSRHLAYCRTLASVARPPPSVASRLIRCATIPCSSRAHSHLSALCLCLCY